MAYREIAMWEILEVLRRVHRGEGQRAIQRVTGHGRATIRRWVACATELGWVPLVQVPDEELARRVAERMQPIAESRSIPEFLTGTAADKWDELAPMLARNGLLSEADTDTLAVDCQTWARYVKAETKLETEGATTVAQSGYEQVSPWVTIAKNCRADLLKYGDLCVLNIRPR